MSKFIRILPPAAAIGPDRKPVAGQQVSFREYINALLTGSAGEQRPNMPAIIAFGKRFDKAGESAASVVEVADGEVAMLEEAARTGLGLTAAGRMSCGDFMDEILNAATSEEAALKRG